MRPYCKGLPKCKLCASVNTLREVKGLSSDQKPLLKNSAVCHLFILLFIFLSAGRRPRPWDSDHRRRQLPPTNENESWGLYWLHT